MIVDCAPSGMWAPCSGLEVEDNHCADRKYTTTNARKNTKDRVLNRNPPIREGMGGDLAAWGNRAKDKVDSRVH